jgi:hypothetical protein
MKFIREGNADPDFLSKLDRTNNIIMCIPPVEGKVLEEIVDYPDTFGILLPRDLNLSSSDVVAVSTSALSTVFRPKLKISFPAGLKIHFENFLDCHTEDIFWKIYRSYDLKSMFDSETEKGPTHYLISDMQFIMYLDTIRMREAKVQMLIPKGTSVSTFYFTWYVQTKRDMPQIQEIYLIYDGQIYEDFLKIF